MLLLHTEIQRSNDKCVYHICSYAWRVYLSTCLCIYVWILWVRCCRYFRYNKSCILLKDILNMLVVDLSLSDYQFNSKSILQSCEMLWQKNRWIYGESIFLIANAILIMETISFGLIQGSCYIIECVYLNM